MGEIEIPSQFQGSGAPGDTLEYLCNIERNNNDSPDLKDWEIKFHGGSSLLTLLHKDPEPKGILNKVVNAFGWETDKGHISFRHTIKGKSERGFVVKDKGNKILVVNEKDSSIVPYWEHNTILNAGGGKLRRLILVSGKVSKSKRKVVYKSARAYWDLKLTDIFKAIEDGIIRIDFDARTTKGRGTPLRNHGTKLRIHISELDKLYESSQVIK